MCSLTCGSKGKIPRPSLHASAVEAAAICPPQVPPGDMNQWIGTLSVKVHIYMFLGVFETVFKPLVCWMERFLDFFSSSWQGRDFSRQLYLNLFLYEVNGWDPKKLCKGNRWYEREKQGQEPNKQAGIRISPDRLVIVDMKNASWQNRKQNQEREGNKWQ